MKRWGIAACLFALTACRGAAGQGGRLSCPSCPGASVCVDDPRDDCDPSKGGERCPGVCVSASPQCGGFAALRCPEGMTCVDDPRDDCDPKAGGADCSGLCAPQ